MSHFWAETFFGYKSGANELRKSVGTLAGQNSGKSIEESISVPLHWSLIIMTQKINAQLHTRNSKNLFWRLTFEKQKLYE